MGWRETTSRSPRGDAHACPVSPIRYHSPGSIVPVSSTLRGSASPWRIRSRGRCGAHRPPRVMRHPHIRPGWRGAPRSAQGGAARHDPPRVARRFAPLTLGFTCPTPPGLFPRPTPQAALHRDRGQMRQAGVPGDFSARRLGGGGDRTLHRLLRRRFPERPVDPRRACQKPVTDDRPEKLRSFMTEFSGNKLWYALQAPKTGKILDMGRPERALTAGSAAKTRQETDAVTGIQRQDLDAWNCLEIWGLSGERGKGHLRPGQNVPKPCPEPGSSFLPCRVSCPFYCL